ncbi:hypothetical protein [Streptomyces sp. NPDC050534]|uniref:hypothetical protein n=1 Tax=Streptomyces sp. NPDC050534 TaxID=3365625 RepID=UPI0037A8F19E
MSDLREVAREYERDADRAFGAGRSRRLRAMAASLRYIAGNRDGMDPGALRLTLGVRLDIPDRWCRRHGYKASLGAGGLAFQRDGEPAQVASVGDTLRWDGQSITVEPHA